MIPKILLFQNGERVIAGVGEIRGDDGQGLCLVIKCPYILSMVPLVGEKENGSPEQFNVNFTKWIAYSSDDQYKIPYSSIIAIGEVEEEILDIYLNKFADKLNQLQEGQNNAGEFIPDLDDSSNTLENERVLGG